MNKKETEVALRLMRIIDWLLHGETGLSGKAIVRAYITPEEKGPWDYPHDPADLNRCLKMLEKLPFIDINIMKGKSRTWDLYLEKWKLLSAMLTKEKEVSGAGTAPKTYNIMKELQARARESGLE